MTTDLSGATGERSIGPAGTVTVLVASHAPGAGPAAASSYAQLDQVAAAVFREHGARPAVRRQEGTATGVFSSAASAVAVAGALRAAVPDGSTLSRLLRIAVHTGAARMDESGRYGGPAVRHAERLGEIANPGQTLLSATVEAETVPDGGQLHDLGMHRLRDLGSPERVFALTGTGAPRSLDAVPNNLPVHLTSFVGRSAELAAVRSLLTGDRLVTLTGTGGSGKTRLAGRAAAELADRWPAGVWWVELAPVTDPGRVSDQVAAGVGILAEPGGDQLRSLTAQLRGRRALVCLDNCEHVLDGAAEVVEALLRSCPELGVLTTSREPLGLPGEAVWRVPSLAEEDALSLFVERAAAVRPSFTADQAGEAAIRALCTRLDGIPLALELAAAWLRTLSPAQIEAGLDDRFGLLVRGPRGAAARQQTLVASIDWSYDLLDEVDRAVFRRLAVFGGTFTLEAARDVCADAAAGRGAVLDSLGRLVDKSLVVADEARFRLLETLREYAGVRLDEARETAATRDRHLDHYLAAAESAEPGLDHDKDAWRARFEPDRDNLRAALDWGLAAPDPDRGRRLAAALAWLWNLRATSREGMRYLRRAIDRAPEDRTLLQARLMYGFAQVADTAAPFELDGAQRGLEIATEVGDDRLRGRCLALIGLGRFYVDFDEARELCEEAERIAVGIGDEFGRDAARALPALMLATRDRHAEAAPLLEDVAASLVRRGDRGIGATLLAVRSDSALVTGDLALARQLAEQAVEVAEPLGDYDRVGAARCQLALMLGWTGDIEAGFAQLEPFRRLVGEGPEAFVPGLGRAMGELHRWRGEYEEAISWLQRDVPIAGPAADSFIAALMRPGLGAALRAAGRDDEAAVVLDRAGELCRRFDLPRALADVHEQRGHLAEDPDRAADLYHDALVLRVEHGLRTLYVDSLEALGALAARTGRPLDAARTLAAADAGRTLLGYARRPADRPGYDEVLAGLRSDPGFDAAWSEGRALTLDDAVAYIRRSRGTRGRPATGWASLTPTELDVVRLAVEGLNNPQIAARLFMSRGTVKTHLAHVYAKLGVANRTELAATASGRL